MNMNPIGLRSALSVQTLVDMRGTLTDLQRQLGTGKKADSYAGIGLSRGLTVGMRNQLSGIAGYNDTISLVQIRIQVATMSLQAMDNASRSMKLTTLQSPFSLNGGNQTVDQKTAMSVVDQMVGLLNTQAGDRFIFSGKATDRPSTVNTDVLMNGSGSRAGLKQIIDERRQADLGAGGLGRLVISTPTATSVTLGEDVAGSPFGFKLAGVNSGLTGATVTGPAGAPLAIGVDFTANPLPGETIELSFNLPDGSVERLALTATSSATPGPGEFAIGATPADTAANFQAVLTSGVIALGATALTAASAVAAGNDFFDMDDANPPRRVDGPPFDSATALRAGTPSDTVSWYTGEAGSDPARQTATGRVDQSLVVSYGARANEEAIRVSLQSMAVFAAVTFSDSDPNAMGAYDALKVRASNGLNGSPGQQAIADIEAEMSGAAAASSAAKSRHQQNTVILENFLYEIEGIPQEEVAAKILSLQTSLQATLQTTAMLLQTSLLKYL
jgi:flagellar hook-associated protein 3 FlgL